MPIIAKTDVNSIHIGNDDFYFTDGTRQVTVAEQTILASPDCPVDVTFEDSKRKEAK